MPSLKDLEFAKFKKDSSGKPEVDSKGDSVVLTDIDSSSDIYSGKIYQNAEFKELTQSIKQLEKQLKIMNFHLSLITSENIEDKDV